MRDKRLKEETLSSKLREHVEQIELLTDELFQMDVQHIADNDHYFPFEELLHNVVLAFSRDPWVLQNSHVRTHKPLLGHLMWAASHVAALEGLAQPLSLLWSMVKHPGLAMQLPTLGRQSKAAMGAAGHGLIALLESQKNDVHDI